MAALATITMLRTSFLLALVLVAVGVSADLCTPTAALRPCLLLQWLINALASSRCGLLMSVECLYIRLSSCHLRVTYSIHRNARCA